MTPVVRLTIKDISHIVNRLKNFYDIEVVNSWASDICSLINDYFNKYEIAKFSVNNDSYMGILIDCISKNEDYYIKVVPKMIDRYVSETDTLKKLPKGYTCHFFEFDDKNNIFVMEKVLPGEKVNFNSNKEKLLALFDVLEANKIIITPDVNKKHKDLAYIVEHDFNIYKKISNKYKLKFEFVSNLYDRFVKSYQSLSQHYEKYLLHGDLYENNILNTNDGIKIIDPLGFIAPYIIEYTPICAYELLNHSNNYKATFNDFIAFFDDRIDIDDYCKALFCQLVKVFIPSIYEANDGGIRAKKWFDIINVLYGLE